MTTNKTDFCTLALILSSLLLLLAFQGCPVQQVSYEALPVSLVELISRPSEFEERFVGTVGVLRVKKSGASLHLNSESAELGIPVNAVRLFSNSLKVEEFSHLEYEYVIVHGVFSSDRKYHPGSYRGSIVEVESIWLFSRRSATEGVDDGSHNE